MKTLILMRHGEAHVDSPEGDMGRRLTERGQRHAEHAGKRIAAGIGTLDYILASNATRAQQTAHIAACSAGYLGEVATEATIYDADWEDLLAVVQALPDEADTALLVGHNPGLPALSAALGANDATSPFLPPAGRIILKLEIINWQDAGPRTVNRQVVLMP